MEPPTTVIPSIGRLRVYQEDPAEMLKPWKANSFFVPIMSTHVLTFICGTLGNGLVVAAIGAQGRSRSATSIFLLSLALADLLLLVFCIPMETIQYFLNTWDEGGSLCKLASYMEVVSASSSVLNLAAITLERYIVIVYPMRSRSFCTLSKCRRAVIIVWIFALILASPVITIKESYAIEYYNNFTSVTLYYCNEADDSPRGFVIAIYHLTILLVLPFLLMVFCYARVIKELWISTKNMVAMTRIRSSTVTECNMIGRKISEETIRPPFRTTRNSRISAASNSSKDAKKARKQVIQMLILIVLLFLCCWAPRLVMDAFIKHGLSDFSVHLYEFRIAFHLLPFIHSCLNPFIYSIMSSSLRSTMVHWCLQYRCFSCLIQLCCSKVMHSSSARGRFDRGTTTSSFADVRRHKTSISTRSSMATDTVLPTSIQLQLSGIQGEMSDGFSLATIMTETSNQT